MMKIAALSALVAVAAAAPHRETVSVSAKVQPSFSEFKATHGKSYVSPNEDEKRSAVFADNVEYMNQHNAKYAAGAVTFYLGVNEFSDLSHDEFKALYVGPKIPVRNATHQLNLAEKKLRVKMTGTADAVDWRTKGAVTPVKNQGQCGSCWSFSTTGSLEGAWEIATKKLVSLSEEMLVDCSKQNHGCGGGSMDLAFQYVEKNGLCTEDSYKYIAGGGKAGTCKASSCTKGLAAGAVTGFHDVGANSEQNMMSALALGPVSIAVEADKATFQSYRSGIMTGLCGTNLDHGILAVGYGTDSGSKYWWVKNSWGEQWGISGFGKLERGKGGGGECGLLMAATYPKVKGSDKYETAFEEFVSKYNKNYASDVERMDRFNKFKNTYDHIETENAKGNEYELGINEFSDLTPEEFGASHFGYKKPEKPWGSPKNL